MGFIRNLKHSVHHSTQAADHGLWKLIWTFSLLHFFYSILHSLLRSCVFNLPLRMFYSIQRFQLSPCYNMFLAKVFSVKLIKRLRSKMKTLPEIWTTLTSKLLSLSWHYHHLHSIMSHSPLICSSDFQLKRVSSRILLLFFHRCHLSYKVHLLLLQLYSEIHKLFPC